MSAQKPNLFGASREQWITAATAAGLPGFRGKQIYRWIYARGVTSFDEMTDLSRELRGALASRWELRPPSIAQRARSRDGTTKYLLSLEDGRSVEAVSIPDPSSARGGEARYTICLSTQVGCPLKCTFCFSGTVPFARNLTVGEIVGQVLLVRGDLHPRPPRINVVFMGMGEPLLNSETVLSSLDILTDPDGLGISPRRITVSTAGLASALVRFSERAPQVGIAISLHATTDAARDRLMPINQRFPLEKLIETARSLPLSRRRKITFEYVLLGGENDTEQDALRLVRLLQGIKAKINLIAYNPWPGSPHHPSPPEAAERFMEILASHRYTVSLRRSRGDDILAACGQLAGPTRGTVPSSGPTVDRQGAPSAGGSRIPR